MTNRRKLILGGVVALSAIFIGLACLFTSKNSPVPNTSLVWSFDDDVGPENAVVEQDENDIYHLYILGRESYEGHVQRPLNWELRKVGKNFSVPLQKTQNEPGGTFQFWFGSVTRRSVKHELITTWFRGDGESVERDDLVPLANAHGVNLDRWRLGAKEGSMQLKLVGGFEGVRNGFIARGGQIFVPGAKEPLVDRDTFMGQAEQERHYVDVEVPGASFEDFLMTVDLAWGDQAVAFSPEVGARGDFGDFFAQIVFLEPFAMGSGGIEKGPFADCYPSQQVRVATSTVAFFASDPAWFYFIYPEMLSKTGRSEIRYFNPMVSNRGTDIRSVTMPIARDQIDRIVLHLRHRRCRAVFPLKHLPVPSLENSGVERFEK